MLVFEGLMDLEFFFFNGSHRPCWQCLQEIKLHIVRLAKFNLI